MNIPFTIEQFLKVFGQYNLSIWPMQIVLYGLAIVAIFLTLRKKSYSDKTITLILAFFWLWMGIVYQLIHFTTINKAAYLFGVLYIIQGALFVFVGILHSRLSFAPNMTTYGIMGSVFLLFALIIYPLLGYFFGHRYPNTPTFGAPCPTTIFTFGILLFTNKPVPKYLLIIPLLWSLVGFSAALNLRIQEDFGLLVAGILGTLLIIIKERAYRKE